MIDVKPSLKTVLKRLKLSGLVPVLPDRAAYAQKTSLAPLDFLELALQDEIDRREHKNLSTRLDRAGFAEPHTFEDFDWNVPVSFDRDRVRTLGSLTFLERHEDVIFLGPTGVGKSSLASALGHAACRAGHRVLFLRSDDLLRRIHQSRADNSTERVLRSLLAPDLLIIDDFGLKRLSAQQSSDFYEVIIERHKRASTIVTSNRAIEEWIPLFDDPILAQSALDRLAHNAHQVVMDGPSYRSRQRPGQAAAETTPATKSLPPAKRRKRA
jgi:DNA replication protein DnaC